MKPVDQTIFAPKERPAAPTPDQIGNCYQAAIASILELPLQDVPHFMSLPRWEVVLKKWLAKRNLGIVSVYTPGNVRIPLPDGTSRSPATYHLINGYAPRMWKVAEGHEHFIRHAVVGYAGEVVFDPHPSRAGLIPERIEEFEFFVPLSK